MKIYQKAIKLKPRDRGFHLITDEVEEGIPQVKNFETGICQVFVQHTSAGITINENADPTVRQDFESHFNRMIPENASYYRHVSEGPDDMPAHLKASVLGSSLTIPIRNGKLALGIWQGIYLCEHRNYASGRKLVITIWGEEK